MENTFPKIHDIIYHNNIDLSKLKSDIQSALKNSTPKIHCHPQPQQSRAFYAVLIKQEGVFVTFKITFTKTNNLANATNIKIEFISNHKHVYHGMTVGTILSLPFQPHDMLTLVSIINDFLKEKDKFFHSRLPYLQLLEGVKEYNECNHIAQYLLNFFVAYDICTYIAE